MRPPEPPGPVASDASLPWRTLFAGFCATLVGLGLARFAYTPLLPEIVDAGWFSTADAAYLGAANLAGYLAGAVLASTLVSRLSTSTALRAAMTLASVAILACAWPLGVVWYFVWRLLSGVAGGALMALAAPAILARVDSRRRGLAGGFIFAGIGLGIVASGTLVPILLHRGLQAAWLVLGGTALVLTAVTWNSWPAHRAGTTPPESTASYATRGLRLIFLQYALNAVGLVPHMIFLVDFIARGLRQGLAVGAHYWIVFGVGALAGPLLSGRLADRIGFAASLRWAFVLQTAAVAVPIVGIRAPWLLVSSFVVGAFTPGVVPLVLGRVQELLGQRAAAHRAAWSAATAAFAASQAIAAYAMSYLLVRSEGRHALLFGIGAAAIAGALLIDITDRPSRPLHQRLE